MKLKATLILTAATLSTIACAPTIRNKVSCTPYNGLEKTVSLNNTFNTKRTLLTFKSINSEEYYTNEDLDSLIHEQTKTKKNNSFANFDYTPSTKKEDNNVVLNGQTYKVSDQTCSSMKIESVEKKSDDSTAKSTIVFREIDENSIEYTELMETKDSITKVVNVTRWSNDKEQLPKKENISKILLEVALNTNDNIHKDVLKEIENQINKFNKPNSNEPVFIKTDVALIEDLLKKKFITADVDYFSDVPKLSPIKEKEELKTAESSTRVSIEEETNKQILNNNLSIQENLSHTIDDMTIGQLNDDLTEKIQKNMDDSIEKPNLDYESTEKRTLVMVEEYDSKDEIANKNTGDLEFSAVDDIATPSENVPMITIEEMGTSYEF